MSKATQLSDMVDSLVTHIGTQLEGEEHDVHSVCRLEAEEFNLLGAPGVGVLLTPPPPSTFNNATMIDGQTTQWNWAISIYIASPPSSGKLKGLIFCMEIVELLNSSIYFAFHGSLQQDPGGPISIYVNDASQTIISLNYVYNLPF
jgi:hypothetical protein